MAERAGYVLQTNTTGSPMECGSCGASIHPGEEYGESVVLVCLRCIEAIEGDEQTAD
jgi:hypothetical protein